MIKRIAQASLVVVTLVSLSGCFTERGFSGHIVESKNVDLIKVGKTSKADVYDILGSPSSKGSFDRDIWYYVGDYRSQTAFMDPKVQNRQVVAIHFNKNEVVSEIERKTLSDGEKVKVVNSKTQSYGTQKGVLEELFGHVGLSPLPQDGGEIR
ncbi:MAG: outer membrane protein assembly factor BamE [Alphaproteobacteria bacterium]